MVHFFPLRAMCDIARAIATSSASVTFPVWIVHAALASPGKLVIAAHSACRALYGDASTYHKLGSPFSIFVRCLALALLLPSWWPDCMFFGRGLIWRIALTGAGSSAAVGCSRGMFLPKRSSKCLPVFVCESRDTCAVLWASISSSTVLWTPSSRRRWVEAVVGMPRACL